MESKWDISEFLKGTDQVIEDTLEAIGAQMVTESQDLCPVVTSNLSNSINYATNETTSEVKMPTTGEPLEIAAKGHVKVGSNVVYAARVEFGFSGQDSLGRTYNQPGTPFLRGALASNKKKILKIVEMAVNG